MSDVTDDKAKRIITRVGIVLAIGFAVLVFHSLFGEGLLKKGSAAPEWNLQRANGPKNIVSLADLRGKVVVLDFWSTTCPPCLEEIGILKKIADRYGPEKVVVVGISAGGESVGRISKFSQARNVNYPLVVDATGTAMALNSSYVFATPGNPDVQAHVAAVAADLVSGYDVDGVHLDYIRYPGPDYSHDDASLDAYLATGEGLPYEDWQREQITATAAGVHQAVDAVRPGVLLTAAVWGIYEDLWGWWTSEGNADYYQDSLAMVDQGALDVIVPMIYWPLTQPPGEYTDFYTLVEFFAANVPAEALWAGMSANYDNFGEIHAEIDTAREVGATGVSVFAYSTVDDYGYWADFAAGPFVDPMDPP